MKPWKRIFNHPMVEYIPLPFKVVKEGPQKKKKQIFLIIEKDISHLPSIGQLEVPSTKKALYLLLFNMKISFLKYRGYTVTIVGERREDYFQVCQLPCKYFYKEKIYFILFSLHGERIAQRTISIHPW